MKMKKILAAVLSLLMLLALFPTVALAVDGEGSGNAEGIVVNKTAELVSDGTYTITLEAYATGTTTTVTETKAVPLDIVLVLDQSGSMYQSNYIGSLKTAVTNFVNTISAKAIANDVTYRIAIAGFASDENDGQSDSGTVSPGSSEDSWINTGLFVNGTLKNYGSSSTSTATQLTSGDYQAALVPVNTDGAVTSSITTAISNIAGSGATRTSYGMEMANQVFANNEKLSKDAQRIVVVFTDGEPGKNGYNTTEANSALSKAYETKNTYGATVYTVGLYSNASNDVTNFMNYLSSNYPNAQSMSATTTTEYEYTPVYTVDESKTYYIQGSNGSYSKVEYFDTLFGSGWRTSRYGDNYYPKTSAEDTDTNHTQFYEEKTITTTTGGPGEKADSKYYMTTSSSGELEKIFQTISQDIETPSTSVTLGSSSVMKDIIGTAFDLPDGFTVSGNISVKTVAGSTTDGTTITWGAETPNPAGVIATADTENNKVEVTGFNYAGKYIAPSHNGEKLVVTITGVVATEAAATGEAVPTNGELSGIYENGEAAVPVKKFDQPLTVIGNKTYVLDYAKTAELTELGQSVTHLDADDMQRFETADLSGFAEKYGTVSYNGSNLTYTPTTTNWDGYDSFFAFGTKDNGYSWSKVSVLPANNVYYEDDFIAGESGVTVGIEYSGKWDVDKTASGNTETANGSVQGWVDSLADDTGYSDGSAHVSDLTNGGNATATFKFTGTGVDIYSRTNADTGTVVAMLRGTADDAKSVSKAYIIDNKAASGDYFQIPTATFTDLPHGEYTVTITVTTAAASEGRYTYYLDGIRVYNPIQDLEETDSTVQGAYENELNATFTEVRGLLNSSDSTAYIDEGLTEEGKPNETAFVGNYNDSETGKLAPQHEVYLDKGETVAINVTGASNYYIGLKAPLGGTAAAEITAGGTTKNSITVSSASDLYYKISPDAGGIIVVKNTGDSLLSITKLRTTLAPESGASAISFMSLDDDTALTTYAAFSSYSLVAYNAAPATEEELEEQEKPEVTEPEAPAQPETPEEEGPGEVVIENPTEPEQPEEDVRKDFINWLTDLFNSMRKIIGRR